MVDPVLSPDDVTVVTEAVVTAGARALEWWRRPIAIDNKARPGAYDPVTEADRTVEAVLRDVLGERFPDDGILGEEHGETGAGPRRWVIDPIDGTRAFVSGSPLWGTLVGLQVGDEVPAGWMHLPAVGETYRAAGGRAELIRGGGVWELRTSATTDLAEAVVAATHHRQFTEEQLAGFRRVEAEARMSRWGGDCTNYGLVAMGTIDLVVEAGMAPYDIAALIPIVEAAGGVVTDRHGGPAVAGGFIVAAATTELHERALALLDD